MGNGKELGGVIEGKTINRIYYVSKNLVSIKVKKENYILSYIEYINYRFKCITLPVESTVMLCRLL